MLNIQHLTIDFHSPRGAVRAVDDVSLMLGRGETLGLVGESGSGKSVTALSAMRLLPPTARMQGSIRYFGEDAEKAVDVMQLPEKQLCRLRGAELAMVFQEPMTSLNPVFRCGYQVAEALQAHLGMTAAEAHKRTLELFEHVRLPDPPRIFRAYPHELSGGQKQRVMIAMAMSCRPSVLIADEPTTALDVTVQKTILDLMRSLRAEADLSMLFISHDLGVIQEIADRVAVMYQGRIVETGLVEEVLKNPRHPYTQGLIACRPDMHRKLHRLPTVADFLENKEERTVEARVVTEHETTARRQGLYRQSPLLEIDGLRVRYPVRHNWLGNPTAWLDAVDQVSFSVYPGESFGLAGESGCGKTTLGRAIARLIPADGGKVRYRDIELTGLSEDALRPLRREIQVVFQDPYASLNPRMPIGEAIREPMAVHGMYDKKTVRQRERVVELLEMVGLSADHRDRYPHEFSGGQRQRICIARALALEPQLLICDEIVSALDVSVQATVLNLLLDLRERLGLTYIFISHDLGVVRQLCDRLLIMNRGRVEALGYPEELFEQPSTEYVRNLIEAVPGKW